MGYRSKFSGEQIDTILDKADTLKSPYEHYVDVGGALSENTYYIMQKYLLTPFMINSSGTTVIPDELLNDSGDNFITDYYWNLMKITGGEPIKTTNWVNNKPNKFIGTINQNSYTIDFSNKIITLD